MEYKRIEDKIVFRLEMGDGLMDSTQKIAASEARTHSMISEMKKELAKLREERELREDTVAEIYL